MRSRKENIDPPVIILGGGANALSIARTLGKRSIKVYALNHSGSHVRFSKYCKWIPTSPVEESEESWGNFLLSSDSDYLNGAVLLTGCDFGLEFIALNRAVLQQKFILDISIVDTQLCMLDKLCTYEMALDAGIPTPQFWKIENLKDISLNEKQFVYPLIVKPLYNYKFINIFGCKFFVVNNYEELLRVCSEVEKHDIAVMLVEKIIGPDDKLCSYYTYMDEEGTPLFDFTKRVFRRFPKNQGGATYHMTDWNPEVKELSLKFLQHVGLIGLANVEFMRDDRDGKLKLIECNARFTAADGLVAASGYELSLFVYNRLTGRNHLPLKDKPYKRNLRFLLPIQDFLAYKELQKLGEINFTRWLKSIIHRQVFPYFSWSDPLPAILMGSKRIRRVIARYLFTGHQHNMLS